MITDLVAGLLGGLWMYFSLLIVGAQHGQERSESNAMAIIGSLFGFALSMLFCVMLRTSAGWVSPWCAIVGILGASTLIYGLSNTAVLIWHCLKPVADRAWSVGSRNESTRD